MPLIGEEQTGRIQDIKGFHPKSMSVYDSYALVKAAGEGVEAFNFQQYITITPKGTWICCWTQGSTESEPDQRIVYSRSIDNGKSWCKDMIIEPAGMNNKVPSWVTCFTAQQIGRVYMFYWYNFNGDPIRDAGDMFFKYSDDDGLSWSSRYRVGVVRSAVDEEGEEMHGWNFGPFEIMPNGLPVMNYNKISHSSMIENNPDLWNSEAFFMECQNILYEKDPEKLKFEFYPKSDHGLCVKHPVYGQNFGQEATAIALNNGNRLAVFRTRTGYLYYAISPDGFCSFSEPKPLRFCANGEMIMQPCASPPIKKLKDGRIILLFHNTAADKSGWYPRHPLWIAVGRETAECDENGGVAFGSPKILVYNDGVPGGTFNNIEISYPQIIEYAGKVYVAYSSKTEEIRISLIPEELLSDFGV